MSTRVCALPSSHPAHSGSIWFVRICSHILNIRIGFIVARLDRNWHSNRSHVVVLRARRQQKMWWCLVVLAFFLAFYFVRRLRIAAPWCTISAWYTLVFGYDAGNFNKNQSPQLCDVFLLSLLRIIKSKLYFHADTTFLYIFLIYFYSLSIIVSKVGWIYYSLITFW